MQKKHGFPFNRLKKESHIHMATGITNLVITIGLYGWFIWLLYYRHRLDYIIGGLCIWNSYATYKDYRRYQAAKLKESIDRQLDKDDDLISEYIADREKK